MQLEGTIKSVTFHSPDSGFSVFRVNVEGERAPVVVTGTFPDLRAGETLKMEGEWGNHPKYGRQFKCSGFEIVAPQNNNIVDYLASGLFKGIGPKTAESIVKVFGDDTADILDNHPELFRKAKIKGFTAKKVEAFLAAWQLNRRSRETMLFLSNHGIASSVARRLWNQYGEDTIAVITENPYILCEEVWGIGFLKADEIAMKVGIAKDSPVRLQAAILYVLQESSFNEGHIYLPRNILLEKTLRNLRIAMEDEDSVNSLIRQFDILCERGRIKRVDDDCFYPPIFRAEQDIADNVLRRLESNALPTEGFERDLASWEREHRFAFDPIQRQAIQMAIAYRISIITGGPGTGKTTILKGILHLAQKMDESVYLAAPTGRAAKRMGDLCGLPARTIHRMLEMDPVTKKFTYNAENQLHCDLLIVDEFSMVDTWLAAALFAATPYRTRIVLVGDADQLPSVGPGNVLNDLIRFPGIPTTRLMHIFRQSGDNDIADKAAKINQGILPSPIEGPNFHFIPFEEPEQAKAILAGLLATGIRSKISIDQKTELQILSPMRKGPLGVFELNTYLQGLMNPGIPRHNIRGIAWSDGDRVMQIKNNYDKNVFNGDIGIIFKVAKDSEKITVFYDDKTVEYEGDELEQLSLAYASTIHKSQGSEYPAVIVILDSSHYMMLQRNLIYTAITRAKGHVWILSAPGALAQAVRNNRKFRRFTRLTERLEGHFGQKEVF
jgi:exodeoxyribonuclease V alpha subunit